MERITKRDIYMQFIHLCNATGAKCWVMDEDFNKFKKEDPYFPTPDKRAANWKEVGAWGLSEAGVYGGWVIQELCNEQGGIKHPFSSNRFRNREFFDILGYMRMSVDHMKRKATETNNQ